MRVNERIRELRREERGVTAVIAAVSLVGLFAALMLAVDAGNVWVS